MAKVGFISLGCPKNLVDSEVMVGLLQKEGHTLTTDRTEAEIIVVNTCSFIEGSRRESIETVLEAAELKNTGACGRLTVTGRLSERHPKEIARDMAEAGAVLWTNRLVEIMNAAAGFPVAHPDSFGHGDADLCLFEDRTRRTLVTPRCTARLKKDPLSDTNIGTRGGQTSERLGTDLGQSRGLPFLSAGS